MAANLIKAGLPVLVFDRNPAAVEKLIRLGAKAASSPQEIGSTLGTALFFVKVASWKVASWKVAS
jgi:3-hydroxyisobutyrate dehydrogenase